MNAITLKNIQYTYPQADHPLINGLNLAFEKGEWTAIIGHNGSGKSTIARLIDGLLIPQRGTITVNGLVVTEENLAQIHQQVGIVFQNPDNQFVGATVADDVAFGLENRQVASDQMPAIVKDALSEVEMSALATAEPVMLSGGQKQRVAIAGILALHPQIIILDEATSMLDPAGRRLILQLLQRLRAGHEFTIISITHDPTEMALADRLVVIESGRVIRQGPTAEILNNGQLLKRIGVAQPASLKLAHLLAARGVQIPDRYMSTEEMVKWLWQKLS